MRPRLLKLAIAGASLALAVVLAEVVLALWAPQPGAPVDDPPDWSWGDEMHRPSAVPGLLYELTATLSKLNLNITSAHVATFGERVVDVFYVTDLLGAKIASPTREVAIKRALLQLLAPEEKATPKGAAAS